mgnify:CR=1
WTEVAYEEGKEIFQKAEEAVADAGRWVVDTVSDAPKVASRAAAKAAKKSKRALEREGRKVLKTMKNDML